MEKINFENLPSTNTPLNADTLNGMQNKIEKSANYIGSTQPSTGEKVWIKTGKNLIDYNSLMWGCAIFSDGKIEYDSDNWVTTSLIEINPDTTYIFSHKLGTFYGRIAFYNSDKTFISLISDSNLTAFTTPSTAKYVAIGVYDSSSITTSRESWMQLEQSTTATTYEPYVEKEILTKNENGVFEKFINIEEKANADDTVTGQSLGWGRVFNLNIKLAQIALVLVNNSMVLMVWHAGNNVFTGYSLAEIFNHSGLTYTTTESVNRLTISFSGDATVKAFVF